MTVLLIWGAVPLKKPESMTIIFSVYKTGWSFTYISNKHRSKALSFRSKVGGQGVWLGLETFAYLGGSFGRKRYPFFLDIYTSLYPFCKCSSANGHMFRDFFFLKM